jgi:predicted nucleic-acid-binding Zn-ribbon protein
MQNGCCPKCGQSEINTRDIHPDADPGSAGLRQSIYVCLGCGYTESYAHPADLVAIRADGRWRSVARRAVTGQTIQLSAAAPAANASARPAVAKDAPSLSKTCPVCGSARIIKRARVLDTGQGAQRDLTVEVERNPNALLFRGASRGTLRARICGRCGYAMLFSNNIQELYDASLEAQP